MEQCDQECEAFALHRSFSAALFELHRHGMAILKALETFKGKKALRKEPLRSIVTAIKWTCESVPGKLISEVKHHLDGLLFHQCSYTMDEEALRNVYYGRSAWLETYEEPDCRDIIFSADENLDESDVAYLCNYCRIYRNNFNEMLQAMLERCQSDGLPLYAYRHAQNAMQRVIDEHDGAIQKLYLMLERYMEEN